MKTYEKLDLKFIHSILENMTVPDHFTDSLIISYQEKLKQQLFVLENIMEEKYHESLGLVS